MPDIVLVTINAKWIHPSLALRLLKANLKDLEASCEIMEFALRQPLEEKVQPILAARPRILGFSVSIWNHLATLELLKVLNEEWNTNPDEIPGAVSEKPDQTPFIVLGGPEVSWLPEEAEIFRYADYVIRGEGEESFRSLCYDLISGSLRTEKPGAKGKKPPALFINHGETKVDVKTISPAYRLYTDEDLNRKLIYVEASRGCPFICEFCASPGPEVREFPLEAFLTQMGTLIDRGARTFKFLDRSFNLNAERAQKIMEFFLERIAAPNTTEVNRPLCVHFEMVPSHLPAALKETLRRFSPGTLRLELGIQTFNPQSAALINRPSAGGQEIENLDFLRRQTNAIIHADLIAGLPGEDAASFAAGFDRLWQALSAYSTLAPFEIQLGILKCLPGTPIIRHNETCKMRYCAEPPYELIETAALPAAGLQRIKNFARFWEIIVNRSPFPDLIPSLLPPGQPVFDKFMALSDRLLEQFGRNWGIDKEALRAGCKAMSR